MRAPRPYRVSLGSAILVGALALGACDAAEPGDGPAATHDVADGVDGVDGVDTSEVSGTDSTVPETVAPSAADERIVSVSGGRGERRDDLFPDVSGDDLVWVQVWFEASAGTAADADCLRDPYTTGCHWDVMHRRLPDGPAQVLFAGQSPRSSPRVGDGTAVWLDDAGDTWVKEFASGDTTRVPLAMWLQATPVPHAGKLWWWGYDSLSGSYAFISYELTSGTTRTGLSTYPFDPNLSPTSPLSSLARRQPFTVTDDAVLFAFWNASLGIQQWPFSGNARPLIEDAERSHLRVLERDDGSLVTLSYDTTADCQPASCALAFTAFTGDIASPLAPAAVPTRYVEPVGDGDRVLWLDRRDGPYALYGVTPDGHELRLSSEKAEIGALSSIAAGNGRVVWADRRSGRWRLMSRDW